MNSKLTKENIQDMVSRWIKDPREMKRLRIHTDTSDFCKVDYNHVALLAGKPYLIRHPVRVQIGFDEEIKYWVKRAIDLAAGTSVIIKLVHAEKFDVNIGGISFRCFRSPKKEARILKLTAGHKNFMSGYDTSDDKGNIIRVLDFIYGKELPDYIDRIKGDHQTYFHEHFPGVLDNFIECVSGIRFLHDNGEKHGDIHRSHIMIDRETGNYRWIDFDINYQHRENIYGYDLFGLGNILMFLAAKGDVLLYDLQKENHPVLSELTRDDMNIVFNNRVANLRKIYPYIPESLNRVLRHFSLGTHWFYEHTRQLLEDLERIREDL